MCVSELPCPVIKTVSRSDGGAVFFTASQISITRIIPPSLKPLTLLVILLWQCLGVHHASAAKVTTEFTFIPSAMVGDDRLPYDLKALELALQKTIQEYGPYQLNKAPAMSKERALNRLKENYYINAFRVFSPTIDFNTEADIKKVDFPVHLGLFSHRICFIPERFQAEVANITHKRQLQDYVFGIGMGWEEKPIFEANKLIVNEVRMYDSLFKMTAKGRIDFFCRSIHEIHDEWKRYKHLEGLTIEKHISIHYPLPLLFYTNKDNLDAIKRLTLGFNKAYEDGSLEKLWLSEYEEKIKDINLANRKKFFLPNPTLDDLGFDYERYFYFELPRY